ncbi:MAG: mannose-1-phosphate guanylyltransferase [Bacteroidales bacterium]|nr:mannose-1-phosphate guanylyltransferase [Bacteroidales bacterium]
MDRYCIIMAGGIGSRFWPVSRPEMPKQFLDFLGTGRTLLQTTFERYSSLFPKENIFVATNQQYREIVKEQIDINDKNILCEPARKNTASCIAYATYHIGNLSPESVLVFAPCDHLILRKEAFCSAVEKAISFAETHDALLTIGIKPTRPETGYGYIQISDHIEDGVNKVKTFTEKPNRELAEIFVESGEFFWNSGIFIWRNSVIKNALKRYIPEITSRFEEVKEFLATPKEAESIEAIFPTLQNISIDFALMEKAQNVYVLCAEFGWSDIGTWDSLYDISRKDHRGNADLGNTLIYDSSDNIISVKTGKLAVIEGLDNFIIADSDDVLLICKKGDENRLRQIFNDVKSKFRK